MRNTPTQPTPECPTAPGGHHIYDPDYGRCGFCGIPMKPTQPTADDVQWAMELAQSVQEMGLKTGTTVLADYCTEWVEFGQRVDLLLSDLPNATPPERSLVEHANKLLTKWPRRI